MIKEIKSAFFSVKNEAIVLDEMDDLMVALLGDKFLALIICREVVR